MYSQNFVVAIFDELFETISSSAFPNTNYMYFVVSLKQLHVCVMSHVMRKPAFCICKNKDADQLYFLNPKFQASNHLLWLYSQVCVGPGLKARRQVFS